jgi:hypothetical protein
MKEQVNIEKSPVIVPIPCEDLEKSRQKADINKVNAETDKIKEETHSIKHSTKSKDRTVFIAVGLLFLLLISYFFLCIIYPTAEDNIANLMDLVKTMILLLGGYIFANKTT